MPRTLAAIFAHPDDETFAMGGTLALHGARGDAFSLYCATDGDAGRASGLPLHSRAEVGAARRLELVAALRMLGLPDAPVTFGAYPDGKLPEADTDHLVGEIVRFIREQRPTVLVTFGPEGAPTGHRDHRAISRAATAAYFLAARASEYPEQLAAGLAPHAAARLYYVSWTPTAGARPPHESVPPTVAVDTAVTHAIEHRAFLAHRTQLDHIASFERDCLTPTEDFALVHGVVQPVEMASGLFEGLGEG